MSSLIKLENVSKIYRMAGNSFTALSDISLELMRGEMTAIMGASGSGKSTLMNIMGCLDRLSSGRYLLAGMDVSDLSESALADIRNQKIGFVFQSFFLLPRMSALENVMLPLSYRGSAPAEARDLSMKMLARVGMDTFSQHKPQQLSGGQQQRVAIARALVGNPEIILADEPTGALDSQTGHEIMALFKEFCEKEGRTIVIITHDQEISRQCQNVLMIKDGRRV